VCKQIGNSVGPSLGPSA